MLSFPKAKISRCSRIRNGRVLGQCRKAEDRGPRPGSPPHPPCKNQEFRRQCPSTYEANPRSSRKKPPPPHAFNQPQRFSLRRRLAMARSAAFPLPVSKFTPPCGTRTQHNNGSRALSPPTLPGGQHWSIGVRVSACVARGLGLRS